MTMVLLLLVFYSARTVGETVDIHQAFINPIFELLLAVGRPPIGLSVSLSYGFAGLSYFRLRLSHVGRHVAPKDSSNS